MIEKLVYFEQLDLEIIVVDDGASSSVSELINTHLEDGIVYVKNNGKRGAASARNLGVKHASGEYVTFLDDDDIYLPGRLSNMLALIAAAWPLSGRLCQ